MSHQYLIRLGNLGHVSPVSLRTSCPMVAPFHLFTPSHDATRLAFIAQPASSTSITPPHQQQTIRSSFGAAIASLHNTPFSDASNQSYRFRVEHRHTDGNRADISCIYHGCTYIQRNKHRPAQRHHANLSGPGYSNVSRCNNHCRFSRASPGRASDRVTPSSHRPHV